MAHKVYADLVALSTGVGLLLIPLAIGLYPWLTLRGRAGAGAPARPRVLAMGARLAGLAFVCALVLSTPSGLHVKPLLDFTLTLLYAFMGLAVCAGAIGALEQFARVARREALRGRARVAPAPSPVAPPMLSAPSIAAPSIVPVVPAPPLASGPPLAEQRNVLPMPEPASSAR